MRILTTLTSPVLAVSLALAVVPAGPDQAAVSDTMVRARVIAASVTKADEAAEARYREAAARDVPTDGMSVAEAAIALADDLQAVPVSEGGQACAVEGLEVQWVEPDAGYEHGAFVPPLGPAPVEATTVVNGVVICTGSTYAFMGFEATRDDGGDWLVTAVPFLGGEGGEHANEDADHPDAGRDQADEHGDEDDAASEPDHGQSTAPQPVLPPDDSFGAIEGYAAYEPQRICDGSAKPGTRALMHLLLGQYPGTRNLGIVRGCTIGGRSEHKEGRAFDWGARVDRPAERQAVEDFVAQLLATDEAGNRHALARRMGVMYMIWNRQIWSAYRAGAGWRPYHGPSPHTDHLHVSLSWNGAMGRTSFWAANGVEPLLALPAGAAMAAPVTDTSGRDADDDRPRDRGVEEQQPEQRDDERRERREREWERLQEAWARREEELRELREEELQRIREELAELEERLGQEPEQGEDTQEHGHGSDAREAQRQRLEERLALLQQRLELARESSQQRTQLLNEIREIRQGGGELTREQRERLRTQFEQLKDELRQEQREQRQAERDERQAQRQAEREERQREREERREQRERERKERRAQKQAEREERQRQRDEARAQRQREREERREQRERERQERREQREREREERRAQKQAEREERQRQRDEARAQRQREREERREQRERERQERREQRERERREREQAETPPPAPETDPVAPAPAEGGETPPPTKG